MCPAKRQRRAAPCAVCANLKTRCGACSLRALTTERTKLRRGIRAALKHLTSGRLGRIDAAALSLLAALEETDEVGHE